MSESASADMLVIGKITSCYGIKGWVKIHSYTEPQENFLAFEGCQLKRRDTVEPIEFDQGKTHGKGLVAHIAGVDDRTLAETYTGLEVVVASNALPALEEGDYYWRQLQGLQVWCRSSEESSGSNEKEQAKENNVLIGVVDYLIETGANDVLVVKACQGSYDETERLIPYLPGETVMRVDLEAGLMEVDWYLDED